MTLEDVDDAPMSPSTQALYVLAMAVLVGSLLLAGSVWFSYQKITDALEGKDFVGDTEKELADETEDDVGSDTDTTDADSGSGYQKELDKPVFDVDSRPFRGTEDAEITIIEFSDFECPFCTRAQGTVDQILDNYDGKVKLVYGHLPLSFHPNAQKAAEASECAADQGKFWEYHDVLFEGNGLDVSSLKRYADDLGLDTDRFDSCLDDGEKEALVMAHLSEAQKSGASGTPTFLINDRKVVGAQPYAVFEAEIESILSGEPVPEPEPVEPTPAPNPVKTVDISGREIMGDESADVVMVEFSEFQCPFCTRVQPTIHQLLEDYDGKLKVAHMNFIVHQSARTASVAAECAADQGKYYEMHDLIFETQKTDVDGLTELAQQLGLDVDQFSTCLASDQKDDVLAEQQKAGTENGIRGTPSFIIGKEVDGVVTGTLVVGAQPIDKFKTVLDPLMSDDTQDDSGDSEQMDEADEETEVANPASVYCVENGGQIDIRDTDAGQIGFCMFDDGSECEEWAYFRGECAPGGNLADDGSTIQQQIDDQSDEEDDSEKTAEPSAEPDPMYY